MLTIYKASAGSGKTFALAYEYIKLLLGLKQADGRYVLNDGRSGGAAEEPLHNRHRTLLAITFTKAATAEMKSRIITQLDKLANIADSPAVGETAYAQMLMALYGCSRTALRTAAARSLCELLNDYGRFNVYTIDSFFQSVLRTFAREIDMQGDYSIAIDRLDVIKQSVSLMLDELNAGHANKRLYEWLKQQVSDHVDKGETYNMFDRNGKILNNLSKGMNSIMNETFVKIASQIRSFMADTSRVEAFRNYLDRVAAKACDAMRAAARQTQSLLDSLNVTDSDDLKKAYSDRLQRFVLEKYVPTGKDFELNGVAAFLDGGDVVDLANDALKAACKKRLQDDDRQRIAEAFGEMLKLAKVASGRVAVVDKMKKALLNLEFMSLVQQTMERYLRETNTMLLSDSSDLLSKIISDSDTPFIYERIGVELQSLLIDEFQDTSHLQWHNLKPLVSNSLATSHDDLIIGDVKQAIYRFRNSDPKLLDHIVSEKDFPKPISVIRGNETADNTNHRSSHQIVNFNSELFSRLADELQVGGYDGVRQTPDPRLKDVPGYVSIIEWPKTNKEDKKGGKGAAADDACDDAADTDPVLEQLAADIHRQHDAGYRWRDIMVLTRKNSDATRIVEYLLERHPDISVLSNEALLLRNSIAVRTAMSLLNMLAHPMPVNPNDADGRYRNTNEAITDFNSRCQEYVARGEDNAKAVVAALTDATNHSGSAILERIRHRHPANVVAALEAIIGELPESMCRQEQAYLAALQDKALEFSKSPMPSAAAFVELYKSNVGTWAIQAGDGLDAVQVMTIHTSKGLEAPCVHIPLLNWELQRKESLWLPLDCFDLPDDAKPPMLYIEVGEDDPSADPNIFPKLAECVRAACKEALADNLNVVYVAFTRARRELCVQVNEAKKKNSGSIGDILVKVLQEMNVEQPDGVPLRKTDKDPNATSITPYCTYTLGEPTTAITVANDDEENDMRCHCIDTAAPYTVCHRDDIRTIVSIDDIFSDDINIGNEYPSSAVDNIDGTEESLRAAHRGNAMHAILSNMINIDGLDAAVARYVAMGRATAEEAAEYRQILHDALRDAPNEVHSWFDPDCRSWVERSIYDPSNDTTYRPDRVVLKPDGTLVIIDYKFTSKALPSHRYQVQRYAELVKQLEPTDSEVHTQAYLWYPLLKEKEKVVKV